jgi:hypothetical protein
MRNMHAPTMPHYIDTVFEMLDELDWGLIDWSGEDRLDFKVLLTDAWERAIKHEYPEDDIESFRERTQAIVDHFAAHMPPEEPVG